MSRIITLTTDFGTPEGCAGAVKGVIASINPQAQIVDVSHQIPPQNVLSAAFCLFNAHSFFPAGTIHLAVVDPGVGSGRKAVLVQTDRHFFIGPDNGIFGLALQGQKVTGINRLTQTKYFLGKVSPTFQGRDLFAPVAAYLSLGVNPDEFGPTLTKLEELEFPGAVRSKDGITGEIIHIDNFGNLVTNLNGTFLDSGSAVKIKVGRMSISGTSRTYSDAKPGQLLAYWGSSGFLEIGINRGNAAQATGAKVGDKVKIKL